MSVDFSKGLVRIGAVARSLGVSPSWVRHLADEGVIPSVRSRGGHRLFDLDRVQAVWQARTVPLPPEAPGGGGRDAFVSELPLDGLEEHVVWREVERVLGSDALGPARAAAHYALTEMVNNAIDHSRGTKVRTRVGVSTDALHFEVVDDGVGAFEHLRARLGLPDREAAILELSKGKRTTDPARHTGEGIFFTSKVVDVFRLEANGIAWTVDNVRGDQAVGGSSVTLGTDVGFRISREHPRSVAEVFSEFTDDDLRFTRTRPSVRLARSGREFVSRSEAKRLLEGLERFSEVELDFGGVAEVGQGFVDEVFRVWPSLHPGTRLVPVRMAPMVEFMVTRSGELGPQP